MYGNADKSGHIVGICRHFHISIKISRMESSDCFECPPPQKNPTEIKLPQKNKCQNFPTEKTGFAQS